MLTGTVGTRMFLMDVPGTGGITTAVMPARLRSFHHIRDILLAHPKISRLNGPDCVELNDFHYGKVGETRVGVTVLGHTSEVIAAAISLLELNGVANPSVRTRLSAWFQTKIDGYTREELFIAAAVLHDVGKGEPGILDRTTPDKTTAIGHAKVGAPIAKSIALESLSCSVREADFIADIVEHHMNLYNFVAGLSFVPKNAKTPEAIAAHRETLTINKMQELGYNPATVLHTIADILGSQPEAARGAVSFEKHYALIERVFTIERISVSDIEALDRIARSNGQVWIPSTQLDRILIRDLPESVRQQITRAGRTPADKIEMAVVGKCKQLSRPFSGRPESCGDKIEATYFSAILEQDRPGRPPAILEITVASPRPPIDPVQM